MPVEVVETVGIAAVALNVELLLPVLGQVVPAAMEGEPVGFTLEHARLGTMAGMTETPVEVLELDTVLVVLPDGVVVPVVVVVPGVTAGAIGIVIGAG